MLVEFGKAGWIEKARQQPDKVRQVLDKMRTDGIVPTVEAVFNKLDEPMPLGYCNAGIVMEVGSGVSDLHPGERVASNGLHAEVVCVPQNLCAKVPDEVPDEGAAFTVVGAPGFSDQDKIAQQHTYRAKVGKEVEFVVQPVSDIPLTARGKLKMLDSKLSSHLNG